RVGPAGQPILLLDQDRARWDRLLIRRGLAALERAEQLAGALGPYALQAAIAACHARARTGGDADWTRIPTVCDAPAHPTPTPTGAVSGTWLPGRPAAAQPGLLIYIMVDSVAATIDAVIAHGGAVVQPVGADAPEITARFRDPAGNVIGLYQEPGR